MEQKEREDKICSEYFQHRKIHGVFLLSLFSLYLITQCKVLRRAVKNYLNIL